MTLYTSIVFSTAIGVGLIITLFVAREAYRRGADAAFQRAGNFREDYAQALEELNAQHDAEIQARDRVSREEFSRYQDQLKACRLEADNAAHDHAERIETLNRQLTDLRLHCLTPSETQLIQLMADKLRLASAALHASSQFADARKAKELAARGDILVKRLRPGDEVREDVA